VLVTGDSRAQAVERAERAAETIRFDVGVPALQVAK
jgi:hypothetical protein